MMPINIRWLDDTRRILLWEIEGRWTLDEMHEVYSRGTDMCLEVPENTVNALIDLAGSNAIPSNIFSALSTRTRTNAPNFDMSVIVSKNALVKVFIDIMNKMPVLHEQFKIVTTREAGLAFIEQRRAERESSIA